MKTDKMRHYREALLALRRQVRGNADHVVESIREDVNLDTNVSAAPVHLADVAGTAVDAEVEIFQTERGMLDEINAALGRIDRDQFGLCQDCGAVISEQRLDAIPYTPICGRCAKVGQPPKVAH